MLPVYVVRAWLRAAQCREQARLVLADARALLPDDFEGRVAALLADLGWEQVQRVGGSGDGGVDIRGVCNKQRAIVQCKRFAGVVAPTYVRDLAGTRLHDGADRALLVTTGHYSVDTQGWATRNQVELWDGSELPRRIAQAERQHREPALVRRERRRVGLLIAGLVLVNAVVVLLAAFLPATVVGYAAPPRPASRAAPTHAPAPEAAAGDTRLARSTPTSPPQPTPAAALALLATVFNSGNVRAQPTLHGQIVDHIQAHEAVELWERTTDAQ